MNALSRAGRYLLIPILLFVAFPIQAQLNVNFSADKASGCSPLTVSFTNKTTGASANAVYKWDLGNGNTSALANPSGVYTEERAYTVTLTVQDGTQTAGKTATITVNPKPVLDFSASVIKGCLPANITFTPNVQAGSGNISDYYWDFGDGSTQQSGSPLTHTYTQPQKASVILTATNSYGCYTTVSKKDFITVLPALKAGFMAPNPVCRETDAVQFTDTSSGPGTLSYAWNFSDGNTSTQQNPLHVYNTKGIYSVTQTVTSSEGCVASKTLSNLNVATFKSDFTVPALICSGPGLIYFNNTSTPAPSSYSWYLNGQQSYLQSTSFYYLFSTPATHTLKLVNTFGTCKDSIEKIVGIKQTPASTGFVADIKNLCGAPATVEFKDTTPNAVKWEWRFDAPNSPIGSSVQNPVYNYTQKSDYTVQLTVTNSDGCKKDIYQRVDVNAPNVSIGYYNPDEPWKFARTCANNRVGFRTSTNEEIVAWKWNFGDGATSTDEKPVHVYTTPGNYQVTLTYTTKKGCTGTVSMNNNYPITIDAEGKVTDIIPSTTTVCGQTPVSFTATFTPTTFGARTFDWDFGDGTISTGSSPSITHQYFKDSTYTVRVIWRGINQYCPDTLIKTAIVKVLPPVPKIRSWSNTCDGQRDTVVFEQSSIKAQSWTWDFGDGATTTLTTDEPTIKHVYANTGAYKVVLTTTNGACSVRDSVTASVLKKQHPLLTASAAEVCKNGPLTVNVSNMESNPHATIKYYFIEKLMYGDGSNVPSFISRPNFLLTYNNTYYDLAPGKKDLQAIVGIFTGSNGNQVCYDTTNVAPLLVKGLVAGFEFSNILHCYNNAVAFKDTSASIGGTIQKWEWTFGDGNTSTQGPSVSHTYNSPGTYTVSLKVTDNTGCAAATFSNYNPVYAVGPLAAFSASATTVALSGTVNFTNNTNTYYAGNSTYKWQIDGADFSTGNNSSYTFNQAGTYTITLIATNTNTGCTSSASQVITVKNFNAAFSVSTTTITPNSCPPVLVRFTNTSQNYTSVKWDFGDGTVIDNVANPSHVYEKAGKYIITLYVYNASGLKGTFYDSVTIVQPEAVIQSSALDVCKGANITLNAVASNTGSYVWDFGDGSVISTTDTFANHQYASPGVYSPVLIMKQAVTGCTGSVPLAGKINVRPDPVVTITPAQPVICKGASVLLQASGGVTYEWLPASDLSNTAIANPVASPAQTSAYTVKIADDLGCKNTGNVSITVIQPVQVAVSGDNEICQGELVNLKAIGAEVYHWINDIAGLNHANIPNPVATPGVTTTYTVTGSDAHSCFSDTADITIRVNSAPSVNAGQDVQSWPSEPVQLQATGSSDVISWNWTPAEYLSCTDCANPVCTPLTTNSYIITVKNQYGCAATDTVVVKLLCNESKVRIPNGITPNGDGKNDEFMIKGIGMIRHLIIFNRWGQKVFDRSNFVAGDRSLCWNGTFNGYPAESGTYVYFVELDCPGGTFSRKGTMTLVR